MNRDWAKVFAHGGINKHWIYKSKNDRYLANAYLEKGVCVIQDFNYHKSDVSSRSTAVYVIMLMAWMFDIVDLYQETLKKSLLNAFVCSCESEWKQAKKYMSALRSFVAAHPLRTDRHPDYSFNGDLICLDICPNVQNLPMFHAFDAKKKCKHISLIGTVDGYHDSDCFVLIYSNKRDESRFSQYLGFNVFDIEIAICLCIDKLTEIDIYLSKLKKKDFVEPECG